jgi:hypothetical protein
MIFINGVAFEKVFSMVWLVSCTAPLQRTYTIVSAERRYLCSTYFEQYSVQLKKETVFEIALPWVNMLFTNVNRF